MSTSNDSIRRQLGFGLIHWNAPEHRPAIIVSGPQAYAPAQETLSVPTAGSVAALAARAGSSAER